MENEARQRQGREERSGKKVEVQEGTEEQKSEETRQTSRVTWLGLGEEWGVVRDVRKMIFKLLTPLERVTVEKAHGMDKAFRKTQGMTCAEWAAQRGHLMSTLQWARGNGCQWDEEHLLGCSRERPF